MLILLVSGQLKRQQINMEVDSCVDFFELPVHPWQFILILFHFLPVLDSKFWCRIGWFSTLGSAIKFFTQGSKFLLSSNIEKLLLVPFYLVLIVLCVHNNLISKMPESCLVANSLLDVHFSGFSMKITESKNGTEVWYYLSYANNYIGTLLTCKIIKLEIHL